MTCHGTSRAPNNASFRCLFQVQHSERASNPSIDRFCANVFIQMSAEAHDLLVPLPLAIDRSIHLSGEGVLIEHTSGPASTCLGRLLDHRSAQSITHTKQRQGPSRGWAPPLSLAAGGQEVERGGTAISSPTEASACVRACVPWSGRPSSV